ncbi:YciI family protein [Gryllotalpicola koreensis]|uniref:YciI family protein n=1 Tax=Gryllotalpicola koreensis TaxID=993086 RepID=A0ABP7ZVB9_9MICO
MRQQFLVLHVTDERAPGWDDAIDRPLMDAWLDHRRGPDGWEPNGFRVGDPATAREIVLRDDTVSVTDGPFPEFKEWFMGVEWIEADDMDQAVELLAKHPTARIGRVMVIPALEDPEGK